MKKLCLVLGAAAVLGACNKNSEPAPTASRTDLLTAKTWQITTVNATVSGLPLPSGQFIGACQLDNTFKFNTDKTLVMDEGATKCSPSDPQTQTGTWAFTNNDQTKISLTISGNVLNGEFDIKEVSASTLRINGTPQLAVGLPVNIDATFSPK